MTLASSFADTWAALAPLGNGGSRRGYHRLAWTPPDLAARAWFRAEADARGLGVETDRNGNLWAWWGEPGPGAVVTGSHLDSVPGGGAFDGPLGVVSALLALDLLRERGVTPVRPLAVAVFADEEGGRFGTACAGSRLLTGTLDPARARALADADGVSLAAAMGAAGLDPDALGRDDDALARIGVFVELHVEQGRLLDGGPGPVGVATSLWAHGRWRLAYTGRGDHAGSTRLADRRDPMLPFAETVLAARAAAARHGAVATVGRVLAEPGAVNAIPAAVTAWLDARAADPAALGLVVAEVTDAARRAAAGQGVTVEVTAESASPEVAFDASLRARVAAAVQAATGAAPLLPSGAGHDAGVLAAEVPTAMLFVRNPTGVSHSPAEHAEATDCLAGVEALAAVLADLVSTPGPAGPAAPQPERALPPTGSAPPRT